MSGFSRRFWLSLLLWSWFCFKMKSRTASLETASSPMVGSSRNRIRGWCKREAPISQRILWPKDNCLAGEDSFELLKDIYQIPNTQYKQSLEELTDLLNLGELLRSPARQLSLGQRMENLKRKNDKYFFMVFPPKCRRNGIIGLPFWWIMRFLTRL